jgi:hypothetical protein
MRLAPPTPAARAAFACAVAVCALSSCKSSPFAHRAEKRAVNGFATALAESDSDKLRKLTSPGFEEVALRDEDALAEVKRLWPAKGKLEVVKVKDVPADELDDPDRPEKIVTVKDERGWKTDHRLVRDKARKTWVIDEIFIKQSQKGITATKTVTEQVAFVGFVRDFTKAWREGGREERLAQMTAACREELDPLPDEVLNHFAARMFPTETKSVPPEATMDDDIAFVRLRRPKTEVVLSLKRIDGRWLVDDAAYEAGKDGDTIPSLRKTAVAYAAASKFLAAYNAADREALQKAATDAFYGATLKTADLATVPLPPPSAGETGQLKVVGDQAELVIESGDRTVKLALVRTDDKGNPKATTEFRVEDVTLYEQAGKVKMRLAAALVAEPIAQLYADALVSRDLGQLRVMATQDFADRVWRDLTPELAAALPLSEIHPGKRETLSTVHNGAVTEVTMMQADCAMTFVLKDEGGAVRVDDVLMAVADRPQSLKATLVHTLPVLRLRAALAAGDIDAIRRECSPDFNRLIWSQVRRVPPTAVAAARVLDAPLAALRITGPEATVKLGDASYGGVISLLEKDGHWKVHDLTVVSGTQQAAVKSLLRDGLANGTLFADAGPSGTPPKTAAAAAAAGAIIPAAYEVPAAPESPPAQLPQDAPEPAALGPFEPPAAPASQEPMPLPQDDSALPFSEPLR